MFIMENGAKIVSSAILGMDVGTCVVNGKAYFIKPPTIKKMAGAGYYLSELGDGSSVKELLWTLASDKAAHALSWMIQGNDTLADELSNGTLEEVIDGLTTAFDMIKPENFIKLSGLTKSIASLIARPKL